ncbi:MAG: hypothetical protein KC503_28625 [Myxococcales bacterium]|nr:hypothetical protein [Myxococcales bacterium]
MVAFAYGDMTRRLLIALVLLAVPTAARAEDAPANQTGAGVGTPQALVLVHGVGNQKPGDYDVFLGRVRSAFESEVKRLTGKTPPKSALQAKAAIWGDVTQKDQETYLQRMKERGYTPSNLDRAAVGIGGDALSYGGFKQREMVSRVKSAISEVASNMGNKQGDLTLVGHSWGSVVSSDAMWDLTESKRNGSGQMPANLKWRRFVTMGGPLAIEAQKVELERLRPVKPEEWTNVWYRRDVVGKPLEPLGNEYEARVKSGQINEVQFRASHGYGRLNNLFRRLLGHLRYSGTAAHTHYWTDPRIVTDLGHRLAHQYVGTYGAKAASAHGAKTITALPKSNFLIPKILNRDVRSATHH